MFGRVQDPSCCTWTYITPESSPAAEACNLNYGIPPEITNASTATHWTGAALARANSTQCTDNPTGPRFPGPEWTHPQLHNNPGCLNLPGWHDIAGAIFVDGVYHVWQGCPLDSTLLHGGWHHSTSTDLVHWTHLGIDMVPDAEPYGAYIPCSGFVTEDDDGVVCAGFRQCEGNWPNATLHNHVPLELRCALNKNLTSFSPPEYLFFFDFNINIPYDPVRPWVGTDGKWYAGISADACNDTWVCPLGGREYLYRSPQLHGPGADWQQVGILFETNRTVLTPYTDDTYDNDLVTANYFGNLTGDPNGGTTRVFTNNIYDNGGGCCGSTPGWYLGYQPAEGEQLVIDFNATNSTGMLDWSDFYSLDNGLPGIAGLAAYGGTGNYMMARTLSTHPNQVAVQGRRILTAWINYPLPAVQALPRDLTLAADGSGLLQQFVPELQILRNSSVGSHHRLQIDLSAGITADSLRSSISSMQFEVTCAFTVAEGVSDAVFGINVLASDDGESAVPIGIAWGRQHVYVQDRAGPLLNPPSSGSSQGGHPSVLPSTEAASALKTGIPRELAHGHPGLDWATPGDEYAASEASRIPATHPLLLNTDHVDISRSVWLHAIVDHQIITVIVNNKTSITVISVPRDENCTMIELFGVDGSNITAVMDVYDLDTANPN